MAKIRLNKKVSGFSVFEIDARGNYVRCISPSVHILNSGLVEISTCLYDGAEIFADVVKALYNLKVKGFAIMGYDVRADEYVQACNVPMQLRKKADDIKEYEFVR